MYLYCHMFSALHDHSKYCTNIIDYLVVSYYSPSPAKVICSYKLLVITLLNILFKRVQILEFFVSAYVYAIATFIADFQVQSGYKALWNASPDGISLTVRAWSLPTYVNHDPIQ